MAASRFQRATALVPLALLSTAVTASLVGVGPTSASADQEPVSSLPDGSSVPTDAIEAPASLSRPGVVAPGTKRGLDDDAVASASASGIPDAALSAYQRAQTVINAADEGCNISWQLIAAIGRVESDHGRANGNSLNDEGLATPGIYGIALDGDHDTTVIRDTDAGQYDADARWDRAVGPMQFIPSTWSVVGVDGDNDGKRNPQDIDDAALATAVYLCSGNDDLSTDPGRRAAVYRYNHSRDYVDLVLSFMDAYLEGDFTSIPNGTGTYFSTGSAVPSTWPVSPQVEKATLLAEIGRSPRDLEAEVTQADRGHGGEVGHHTVVEAPGTAGDDGSTAPGSVGTGGAATTPPADSPSTPPADEPTPSADPDGQSTPSPDPEGQTTTPADPGGTTAPPTESPAPEPPPATPDQPEATPPTEEEATQQCLTEVGVTAADLPDLEALGLLADFNTCMAGLGHPQ